MTKKIFLLTTCLLMVITGYAMPDNPADESSKPAVSGFVKDASSGESLPGATVYIKELKTGTITNVYGFYSIRLSPGDYTVIISYIGYENIEVKLAVQSSKTLNAELKTASQILSEVVISDERGNENVSDNQMSSISLNTETIKRIPALMGEVDVLKTVQLLPGVQQAAEGFSGFSVRGGSTDQNLILLDEATVYNASHLMGFFSVFNSDAIKDMTIYKGDIPAQYGGRLSSLLDIRMKEGNMKKFSASGGIGSISSRMTLEGPIVQNRSSYLVSGRRTYADMFLALSDDPMLQNNKLYFYDLNLKTNYIINHKNRLYLSGYFGRDVFSFQDYFDMSWGNATYTMRWNRIINDALFVNYSLIHSNYQYGMDINQGGMSNFRWESHIMDYGLKADYTWYPNTKNTVRFGLSSLAHFINPGTIIPHSGGEETQMPRKDAIEYAVYASNEQKIGERLSIQYGLRMSACNNIGKSVVYNFSDDYTIVDSVSYDRHELYNFTPGLEPRLSLTYLINTTTSIKSGYSRTFQYMQPASNSNAGMPTDVWFTTSPNVKPQLSDQVAAGVFKNLFGNKIEISAEAYYKYMQNQIDFKDNAVIFFNEKLETEIRTGIAEAYGIEFLIRKQSGAFTGWIGYTLSKAQRKISDLNNGNWYNTNTDKPHNLNIVMNYTLNKRINLGANWVYTTGAPTSLPTGRWEYAGLIMPSYSARNSYRLPAYHRLDVSFTCRLNKKENARFYNELNISCYNVYNRKNPFTIYFEPEERGSNKMKAYALSMFGIVPAITWNVNF